MFPVKGQGNIYPIHIESNNQPCPYMRTVDQDTATVSMCKEGEEPRLYFLLNMLATLSRTQSSCHHTDMVHEVSVVSKSRVQLPCQFQLECYANSQFVEL